MKYKEVDYLDGLRPQQGRVIFGNKVKLRDKKLSDARNDYGWQTDPELARLDATMELSVSFPVYLLDYTQQLRASNSKRFPFAVETLDGRHIGNCTCYDIDKKKGEAQLGIMIGDREYWDNGYGTDALTTLVNHIFLNTGLRRVYLKTLDWNRRAQQCFKKCGFTPCGQLRKDGYDFVLMELKREQWLKQREES